MKEISVVIPVYNTEEYLRRCLTSVIDQTIFEKIQIIIVNDGTKDNSESIIKEFINRYPSSIRYYKKENGGLSSARNLGIKHVETKYVTFLDSDDYVESQMYEKLYCDIEKNKSDISICGLIKCDVYGNEICFEENNIKGVYDSIQVKELMLNNKLGCYAWNKLYSTELFKNNKIEYPIGRLYEDIVPMYRLINSAKYISFINEPLYYYVQQKNSICYNPKIKTSIDMLINIEDIISYEGSSDLFSANWLIESSIAYNRYILRNKVSIQDKSQIKEYKIKRKKVEKDLSVKNLFKNKNFSLKSKVKFILYKLNLLKIIYFFVIKYENLSLNLRENNI